MAALSHALNLAEIKKKLKENDLGIQRLTEKLKTVEHNASALFASTYFVDQVERRLQGQIDYMKEEMDEMKQKYKVWPVELVTKLDQFFQMFENSRQDQKKHDIVLKKITDFFASLEEDLR